MQAIRSPILSPGLGSNLELDEFAETVGEFARAFNGKLNLGDLPPPQPQPLELTDSRDKEGDEQQLGLEEGESIVQNDGEEVEDGDDFSFVRIGDGESTIAAEEAFQNGQIRPIFPFFNQNLVFAHEALENQLPIRPTVGKIFVESPRPPSPSSSSESEEIDRIAEGPFCTWSKEAVPEACKKSNSTGFSKLWRFKDKINRSNSDGRDTFVFLNDSTSVSSTKREEKVVASERKAVTDRSSGNNIGGKGNIDGGAEGGKVKKTSKKGGKGKALSPHEIYLRNRELMENDRRRSYLPYRPELMGFFTNVNFGLSRNIHPF